MEDKKYTNENHYSKIILDKNDTSNLTIKEPKEFLFTGNYSSEPVNIVLHDKDCWIKKGELEILKQANINLEDIKVLVYVEGLLGPYNKNTTTATAIDGYKIFILN